MLGVEHDEVKTGESEDFDQGPITGETLHSQRNLALLDHGEQTVVGLEVKHGGRSFR
jgi:hypothetical protein